MRIEYFIYVIQHNFGIQPKWERDLIENDTHLKTYKRWMRVTNDCSCCHELYHNRLNYLKGWLK
jgi:hypothetical protein